MIKTIFSLWISLILSLAPASAVAAEKTAKPTWPQKDGVIDQALFRPSPEEQNNFMAAFAVSGGPDGLRRGFGGPSVYCGLTDQMLEVHWRQVPQSVGDEKLALGYGEMTLRHQGEQFVLQRYRGEFKNGFREGRGELLARDPYAEHGFVYRGDFRRGHLEGMGVYVSTDFHEGGEAPFIYEGEFRSDTFHGRGVMKNLATGEVIHRGLWFEGFPFEGGPAKWARAEQRMGLENRLAARPVTAGSAGE